VDLFPNSLMRFESSSSFVPSISAAMEVSIRKNASSPITGCDPRRGKIGKRLYSKNGHLKTRHQYSTHSTRTRTRARSMSGEQYRTRVRRLGNDTFPPSRKSRNSRNNRHTRSRECCGCGGRCGSR
jgi:hypothetical protein